MMSRSSSPYEFYKWFNAWLLGTRRDSTIADAIGPAFACLFRAQEKLPFRTANCGRGIKVNSIPGLKDKYDNWKTAFATGQPVNFWGFSSFSTDSDVVNKFKAKTNEESIVYCCGSFSPGGLPLESEVLPLAPAMFTVTASMKVDSCVVVTIKQEDNYSDAYVKPTKKHVDPCSP